MDRARRSHRQLEALIAKLEDRMASLEQRESELQYDLNTNSLPYISTSDDPTSSDRIPPRPTPRPRTNPERGGYPRGPQSRNFIDLLEDEIRRFQLEKQEADIKWQKRQKELLTQLQSIRSDFLPEPEYSRSVDSIQSADIENIQRLNRLAEEVSQKKRRVAELERQLHEKVKQAPPSPEQGVLMQRAPGQSLRPRLSSTSLAQLHRIMRELENFICAIEEEDYKAADQLPVPSEGPRTATSAMGGDDATQDMIRLQQKEIENLKQQLASVTNNYMVAKQESDNMRQELNELKAIVLGESGEPKLATFDEIPAEADIEPPPTPETPGEESEIKSEEEVTKEEDGGTGEEAVPAEQEIPIEEETVTAEEEAAPAEDEVSKGGEEAAPTEEEAIPAEEEAAPTEEEAAPVEEEAAPAEEEAAPAEDEVSTGAEEAPPTEEEAIPAEEEAAPTEEEAAPVEDEVSTGGEEAAPTEEEALPAEEEAAPAEEEAAPVEEEAAPAEDEVSTGGEEAAPSEEEAAPAEEEAAPTEEGEEAVPVEEEAVPAEETILDEETAAPVEDEVSTGGKEAPVTEEEAASAEEKDAPAKRPICICPSDQRIKKKRSAPGGKEAAPSEETAVPVEETAAIVDEETAPTEEGTVPAEEEAAPTEEEAAPAEEEAAPAEDEVSTGGEEAAPTEEEAIPAEEEAATTEEEAAPVEDEVSTGGEEAAPTEEEAIPAEEEAAPAEEEAAPVEEEAAPAEDEVSTGGEEAAPSEEEAAPAEEEAAPTEEEEAVPDEEEAVPDEEEAAPAEEEETVQAEEEAAPTEEGEEAVPVEEEAVPAEETILDEETAAPVEDEVSTGGKEAPVTEEEAASAEEKDAPAKRPICKCPSDQRIKKKRSAPGGKEAAPSEETAVPVEETAAIVDEETVPAEEEAAPVEEEAAPAEDEVSTGGEEAAPTEEEAIPAEEEAAPTEEEAAPVEDEVSTGGEEAAPTEEEALPAEEEAAPAEEEAAPFEEAPPVEEEAVPSGEEAAPSEEGAASSEEPVVISEEGQEAPNEDEDEDDENLVFIDVSRECCCPEGRCACCLDEGLESCKLSPTPIQECIVSGDAETPEVHKQGSSEPILYEVKAAPADDGEEFVEEEPTEEQPNIPSKCFCDPRKAAKKQPGVGDQPVPEEVMEKSMEPAVQEPSKPGASEETVEQSAAPSVAKDSKFSVDGPKSVVAEILLDIAARVTAERSIDNVEDLTRAIQAELEGKEYLLTNEDVQKILEDIIDSYTQYPFEKEALAGEMKKMVDDVVHSEAEPSEEKERVAEDIQTILEGIMQRYSVSPMGEGEPEAAKPEVPMKVIQAPKPIAQVSSGKEAYPLELSSSDLGCQVLCWDASAFQPVVRDEEARVPEARSEPVEEVDKDQPMESEDKTEPVEEMDSDQPMDDSEDKTEPFEEVDTDQTLDSEDKAEPVEEVDMDQTVDSEEKTEPVEEVDIDQTVDSEDKAEPVEEVDADQPIEAEKLVEEVDLDEPVDSEDKTEPVEVSTDQTVDSEDKTEPVEEVDTDQPEDSEDKTEPVEEADKDEPVDSEQVEDVLPEADETAPEDSQEMPLQEEISSTESPSSDMICDKSGKDVPAPECIEECICTESDELLDKDKIPPTELPASDVVRDKPDEGEVSEDSQEMPIQEKISSTESPSSDMVCDKSGKDVPAPECIEECICTESDELLDKDNIPPTELPASDVVCDKPDEGQVAGDSQEMLLQEKIPSTEPPTSDVAYDKPAEGDINDLKDETDGIDVHRLERVSSSTTQIADEFPLQDKQPYRLEKVTSSLRECAFEFGSFKEGENVPYIEGTKDTTEQVKMEEGQDGSVAPESGANDVQETGDLSEEGSPTAPEVTAEDAEETEDGSEQVSPIDHESSVDDLKETDGGEEVSPIIPESGTDETNEREGVSEEAVIAPVGGVDESKETPEEICSISFETGGEQEIPEQNIVDENTADVQEQILEPSKPKGDEIVEKPETTDEVIVHEKADGGIEEKAEIIGKEICTCSDSVEELYKKESEFTEETPTITSSPDDAIISECGTEDTDLEGKESKEDFEIDKRIESEKAFLEEEPTVQPGDSVEVMVVNHVDSKEEFIKDDSEKLDETEISYDGDTESEASDMEQSRDAQPKTNATNDFETVFKKDVIEDINLICKCSDISLTDYSPSSVENDDSEYDTALSCPDHDELFTEESYPSDTEPTPKEEYVEDIDIDVVVEKGGGGKSYSWDKGSYDAVNFEGEILFSSMAPHETTSEDSAARVSIDSVLEADDEGQETAYEVDQQVMFHYEGVRDILVQKVPKESKGSVFIPATPSKVQHDPILQQIQPMTRVSEDNQEHGEPSVKSSVSRDSKKRPSSEASKERMRESSIDRKRRWSKVKEEDSDLRVQINELNKRMAAKSKMLLDMEANLKALKGGAPKGEQKLPLTKSAIAMVFSAIKDGLGALSCKCFKCGSPPPQPPCATSSSDPLDNSQPFPCASCSISSQDTPSKFPCEIKCPFHMPPPPCNRWLLERPMCSRPPGPGELVARRVDNDSLLIRWGAPRNTSVTGFDIYVNGTVVNRVRGPGRSIAMLTGLNLGCKTVICVYAMTPSGTYGNPMSTVYQPPTCLPCCKMREKGITDKSSHADVHTYGSKH